jgi:hypothetical protein
MSDDTITVGEMPPEGFVLHYYKNNPDQLIVKIKGTLSRKKVSISGLVIVNYGKPIEFKGDAKLKNGDKIYLEPDGLTILKDYANVSDIEPIDGRRVMLGLMLEKTFIAYATDEA